MTQNMARARQFLSVDHHGGRGRLHLHRDVVDSQLLARDVADKPVVVMPVAGPARTGKSFLLNAMVKYLTAPDKARWLENRADGFSWRGGPDGHTQGMFMSDPIPIRAQSGEQAVLVLMDTQGVFDGDNTATDTAIFALSTLLSSVQVYNVKGDFKRDAQEHLQLFAEYGRLAKGSAGGTPFQDLVILVRDWDDTDDHQLGDQGGTDYIERQLRRSAVNAVNRQNPIRDCFPNIGGFLMPYPGRVAARSSEFVAEQLDPAFVETLNEWMSRRLSSHKLPVKTNGNRPMTCRQLATFIETYVRLLQSCDFPEAKNILEANAEARNLAAVNHELSNYVLRMENRMKEGGHQLDENFLHREHQKAKAEALKSFRGWKILRDTASSTNYYSELLDEKIESWFRAEIEEHKRELIDARSRNEESADYLIKKHKERVRSPERYWFNPVRYMPSWDSTIRERHEKAEKEAIEMFNMMKIEVGAYTGQESKEKLVKTMKTRLEQAVKDNKKVQLYWGIGTGVVVLAGAGAAAVYCYGLSAVFGVVCGVAKYATIVVVAAGVVIGVAYIIDGIIQFFGRTEDGITSQATAPERGTPEEIEALLRARGYTELSFRVSWEQNSGLRRRV